MVLSTVFSLQDTPLLKPRLKHSQNGIMRPQKSNSCACKLLTSVEIAGRNPNSVMLTRAPLTASKPSSKLLAMCPLSMVLRSQNLPLMLCDWATESWQKGRRSWQQVPHDLAITHAGLRIWQCMHIVAVAVSTPGQLQQEEVL